VKNGRKGKSESRGKYAPPEIYVLVRAEDGIAKYSRAHLRIKRGYHELCWRDGDKVRTYHLPKRVKASPTRGGAAGAGVRAAGARGSGRPRRGEKRG
jgi:hypothetical protein